MSNTGKNKTTLHRLEEKINKAYPTTSETIGTERERIVVEILDLLREEYDNERDMVIHFSMGVTQRMDYQDIEKKFDETFIEMSYGEEIDELINNQ
jgi:hypothetical protein